MNLDRRTLTIILILSTSVVTRASDSIQHQDDIKNILIVVRHGDRNVISPYPGDPNTGKLEASEWGAMRSGGCVRLYRAGRHLANHVLPVIKHRNSSYLRAASNPFPLVIKSLECFMAGVNGPDRSINSSPDPPIDVPYGPSEIDTTLNFGRINCPMIGYAARNGKDFLALRNKYSKLIETLANGTGEDLSEKGIVQIVISRFEPIVDEERTGLERAPFVDDYFIQQAIAVGDAEFDLTAKIPVQRKLSSFLVRDIISKLRNASDGLSFTAYASVCTSMVPMMETVGLWRGLRPTFGEAMIFISRKNGQFEEYFYDKNFQLRRGHPPGCPSVDSCTLDDFESAMKVYYTDDYLKDCQVPTDVKK